MAQTIEWKMTADERDLVSAWMAGKASVAAYEAGIVKLDRAQDQAAKSGRDMGKVRAILDSLKTPAERAADKVQLLKAALDQGTISAEEFRAGSSRINEDLRRLDPTANRLQGVIAGIGKAWAGAAAAVALYSDAVRKSQEASESSADRLDRLERQFQVSADLTDAQAAKARETIKAIAIQNATTPEAAYATANAAASAGFSNDQILRGGVLGEFLKIQSAQALAGKASDAETVVASTTQLLAADRQDLTATNVNKVGVAVQALKETPLVFEDLKYVAKEFGSLKASGLNFNEALSTAGELRRTFDASEGLTGLRNVASRLATAGASKDRIDALAELKLKPADVDGVGENFSDAVKRVFGRIQEAPAERRNEILTRLFESTGVAPFMAIATGRSAIDRRSAILDDPETFNRDVRIAQSGRTAAKQRLETEALFNSAARSQLDDVTAQAFEAELRSQGVPEAQIALKTEGIELPIVGRLPGTGYRGLRSLGFSPETALGIAENFGSGQAAGTQRRVKAALGTDQATADPLMVSQNRLLQEQNALVAEQVRLMRGPGGQPNTAPPKTPASKGRETPSGRP